MAPTGASAIAITAPAINFFMKALFPLYNSTSMKLIDLGSTEIECKTRYQILQSISSQSNKDDANDALHSSRFIRDSLLANHDQRMFRALA